MRAAGGRSTRVTSLRAGGRNRPVFLATSRPALSWQVVSAMPGWIQQGCEIEVVRSGSAEVSRLDGDASQAVAWPARPLGAYETASARVRVRAGGEPWSPPSEWLELRTGPLGPADWVAPFVAAPRASPGERPVVRFRRAFDLGGDVRCAVLSVTAHGVYHAVLNGRTVGDEVLAPGWTAYADRLLFQSYDVTDLLLPGGNVLGVSVADGWYRERYGFGGRTAVVYEGAAALSAQLRIERLDGAVDWIVTGPEWSASDVGPVLSASIYQGEHYDARLEDRAFVDPDVDLRDGSAAVVVTADATRLRPSFAPPVREIETLRPVALSSAASGATIVDFGQNLVGWLRLRVDAPGGTTVRLRHAEVLQHGELAVGPLRDAAATDSYTSSGAGEATWSPRFTFHGFRYAEISGWPGELAPTDVTAVVVHSDMARTGWLDTGDEMLDRLHANVVWSWRGNSLGIPTDCPQRDERMGWTGDIAAFAPTAGYLYDCAGFLASWLVDLALEQSRRGGVGPVVVPDALATSGTAAAAWGDAATLVPEALYRSFGDVTVLETQYESMRAWVEVVRSRAGDDHLWTGGFQYGDWLDPSAPPEDPARARTDPDVVASAYYYRSTSALAAAARVLGRAEEAREYEFLAGQIRSAFVREYVTEAGRVLSDAHSAYALAIAFGLLDDPGRRAGAGDRLAELARAYGYRIRSGFVGTPIVCDALVATGHPWAAFRLLTETGCPSWLYPVSMGATTIWERWDSMLEDGSVNPGQMTSFNHYALGAVADWMHRTIGGIAPGSPGYRLVEICPVPGGGLQGARSRLETGYGRVEVAWALAGEVLTLSAQIPANSRARVTLPGREAFEVGSGAHEWSVEVPGGGPDKAAGGTAAAAASDAIGLESSLAEIVDDGDAMAVLLAVFAELDYRPGLSWTEKGAWRSDSRLGDSLVMLPAGGRERIARALAELDVRR